MAKGKRLGWDELMIVNPGVPNSHTAILLAEDGSEYEISEPLAGRGRLARLPQVNESTPHAVRSPGGFLIGDDGTLYEIFK